MKLAHIAISLSLLSLVNACSTIHLDQHAGGKSTPETVLVTYHVKSGQEDEFQHVLAAVWAFYRQERLVFVEPHVIARADDGPGNSRFIELFTWVSHSAPEHVPPTVGKLWDQLQSLCESRDNHSGIDITEVDLVTPLPH